MTVKMHSRRVSGSSRVAIVFGLAAGFLAAQPVRAQLNQFKNTTGAVWKR
jgi:hypothetical protein